MTCLILATVSGPCSDCGAFAEPAHVTDGVIRRAECCHKPASHDWAAGVADVGEQKDLFEEIE